MKKYVISIKTENAVKSVNDYIIINSLFTVGETITDPGLKIGENYTDDERIYQAVCAFINEGGKDTEALNLCAFDAKTFAFAKVLKNFGLDKFFLHFLLQIVRINIKFAYFLPSSQITFRQITERDIVNTVI